MCCTTQQYTVPQVPQLLLRLQGELRGRQKLQADTAGIAATWKLQDFKLSNVSNRAGRMYWQIIACVAKTG